MCKEIENKRGKLINTVPGPQNLIASEDSKGSYEFGKTVVPRIQNLKGIKNTVIYVAVEPDNNLRDISFNL